MRFILDTSSLINLRDLGWLNLLRYPENSFSCPDKVEQEIRRKKRKNKEILKLIQDGVIAVQKIIHPITFSLLSNTDSDAISLGIENKSTVVSEDGLLRQNAILLGVPALDIAGMLFIFFQEERIEQNEYLSRLKILFEHQTLSKSRYHQLLMALRS
jgi:predicted nucleic acid-binding protein